MVRVIKTVRIILIVLLGGVVWLWGAAIASGHNIRTDTNVTFGCIVVFLVLCLITVVFAYKKKYNLVPSVEEIQEALGHPNGFVYVIDSEFDKNGDIPPYAIKGCWKVNEEGVIVGQFIYNPDYGKRT